MNAIREKFISDYVGQGIKEYHCPDTVSPDSLYAVKNALATYVQEHNIECRLWDLPGLDLLGDEWVIAHSKDNPLNLCGTFPKRIAKYLYEKWNFKAPPDLMGVIGNLARDSLIKEYYYDIVDKFEWDDGDFGDEGSCYWGGRSQAKDILIECFNAMAVRFYKPYDSPHKDYDGYGRAWIVPFKDDSIIIYNAYPENFKLVSIARMLATILGMSYKKIELEFNGDSTGTVWINGHSGYLIHPFNSPCQELTSVDLEYEYSSYTCYNCGDTIDENELYYYDGDEYCDECYHDIFNECECCGTTVHRDNINCVNDTFLCDSCLSDNYSRCDECGEYVHNDYIYYSDGESESFCESCYADLSECQDCGNMFRENNLTGIDDENGDTFYLCNDCIKPYKCQNCGDVHYFDRDLNMFCVDKHREYCVCIDCIDHLHDLFNLFPLIRCDFCHSITTKRSYHRISYTPGYEYACDKCQEQGIPAMIDNVPNLYELTR